MGKTYGKELKADSGGDYDKGIVLGKDNNMQWSVKPPHVNGEDQMKESVWADDGGNDNPAFDPKTGIFTVPHDGLYNVAASVRVDGSDKGFILFANVSGRRRPYPLRLSL